MDGLALRASSPGVLSSVRLVDLVLHLDGAGQTPNKMHLYRFHGALQGICQPEHETLTRRR